MKFTFSTFTLLLIPALIFGMQQPKDFGDISKDHLRKEIYAIDSSASAIVLFDIGRSYVDTELRVRFTRHVRIKVLSDEGMEQGDVSIGFRQAKPEQDIKGVEAVTYNLNDKGKIDKTKLRKRDIYEEKSSEDWSQVKFTIPALKKGSIFEYKYELISESPVDLKGWKFQQNIPVLWSEYTAEIPEWFKYLTFVRSFYPVEYSKQSRFRGRARVEATSPNPAKGIDAIEAMIARQSEMIALDYIGTKYEWAMKDIPALKDEPFINSVEDYSAKVILQLNSLHFPQAIPKPVLTDWLGFVELLEDHTLFGKQIKSASILRRAVEDVTSEEQTDYEKIVALYQHVRDRLVWNEYYELLLDDNVGTIYENGEGNGSEINGVLIQMLREAGLEADPVVLSTKSHGEILDIFPIAEQFNHMVASVVTDSAEYLLDATQKNKPYDLLPVASQNGQGLLINSQKAAWVPLVNKEKATSKEMVTVVIDSTGHIKGSMDAEFTGYYAYSEPRKLDQNDAEEVIHQSVFNGAEDIKIEALDIKDVDKDGSFRYALEFSSSESSINDGADIMYINPFFVRELSKNPFSEEERKYPVDFSLPYAQQLMVRIQTPKGWEVQEAPESKIGRLPNGMGEFRRMIQPSKGMIVMMFSLEINTYKIMPENYPHLREMFNHLVQSTSENIVLKKMDS